MSDILERTLQGLRAALLKSPDNGGLWLQIAELLAELGRENESKEACREALQHLDPGDERARAEELLAEPAAAGASDGPGVFRLFRGGKKPARDQVAVGSAVRDVITFASVGGLDELKEEIRMKIILPFQRPDVFRAYGKRMGGGILLYGPPGCGKTLLARATAGECAATFFNVAIDAVLDMWFGESERKLAVLFEDARNRAPSVLFLDELEALGGSRQLVRHSPGKTLVNQLLSEMDGVQGSNEKLLVLGATNAPWHVDPALRRPGRFDRVLFVPPPDAAARLEILSLYLRARPTDGRIDVGTLSERTVDFSGADLFELIERASEVPLREALRSGEILPLTQKDLERALKAAKPTTREWFATAKNYATFSNTGGLYDDLITYLDSRRK